MFKDIHKLSKIACRIDKDYTAADGKPIKEARLLKRALSIEKKLLAAVAVLMPVGTSKADILLMAQRQLSWTQNRINNRVGRIMTGGLPNV